MVQRHEGLIVSEDESYTHPEHGIHKSWLIALLSNSRPLIVNHVNLNSVKESECMYFKFESEHRNGVVESFMIETCRHAGCMHVSSRAIVESKP
jgi:hypothetical protein